MEQYLELYKKHRPRKWEDVIGQDTVVNSLKYAVQNNKIPTGFLFSGTAGTGKTTLALILAKALNCEHVDENGNPCNECPICKAIDNNALLGIKYISMANNGSADDIRRIMEESRVAQPIKKKVFILDEVHNMSSAAQDAMLISLEADNQSTLFICCTTDPDKIKPAILSRLQQRSLRQPTVKELAQHLVNIIRQEPEIAAQFKSGKLTKEQVIQCAKLANGSVRNSISNLETIISAGSLPIAYANQILLSIVSGNPIEVYNTTAEMAEKSANFVKTTEQVYRSLVEVLKVKSGATTDDHSLDDMINKYSGNFTLVALDEVGKSLNKMSNKVIDYRILAEVCFTKLALLYKKNSK